MLESILFLSQAEAQRLVPTANQALISIFDSQSSQPVFEGWQHLHFCQFDDTDKTAENLVLFDQHKALAIKHFVDQLPENITTLYVHCKFGVSRSAAVSKALCQYKQLAFNDAYSPYNKLVFRQMEQALFARTINENTSMFKI